MIIHIKYGLKVHVSTRDLTYMKSTHACYNQTTTEIINKHMQVQIPNFWRRLFLNRNSKVEMYEKTHHT